MCCQSNSGSGVKDGPKFIRCIDGGQPQIHDVWNFRDDGVTREVHTTAHVDVGTAYVGEFAINYLTPTWRRVSMFGRNYINGSVKWLGIPDFLRND